MRQLTEGYYSSLADYLEWFMTGVPILTYHKIGPRPRRVRLKGLYLSSRLFSWQLSELRRAGFITPPLGEIIGTEANGSRRVLLSFDDGYYNVWLNAMGILAENGFRAMQYLVANCIGKRNEWDLDQGEAPEPLMNLGQVREWLAAGHEIGSHTMNHRRLTQVSLSEAREEISASKKGLEDLLDVSIDHFCYPYGDWNPAVRDLVAEAGYHTAVTSDFGINTPGASPFALKRITARYRSRNWKTIGGYVRRIAVRIFRTQKEPADRVCC